MEPLTTEDISALDHPVAESLRLVHADFAVNRGRVSTYAPEVATFSAVPAAPDRQDCTT
jgi:hypothetical protein